MEIFNEDTVFTKQSLFSDIQEPLKTLDSYCLDVENYLGSKPQRTIGEVVYKLGNDVCDDMLMNGRILTCMVAIGKNFETDVNDELIQILLRRNVHDMKLLLFWRRMKNWNNVSTDTKETIIKRLKNKLPKAEKKGEWDYE